MNVRRAIFPEYWGVTTDDVSSEDMLPDIPLSMCVNSYDTRLVEKEREGLSTVNV